MACRVARDYRLDACGRPESWRPDPLQAGGIPVETGTGRRAARSDRLSNGGDVARLRIDVDGGGARSDEADDLTGVPRRPAGAAIAPAGRIVDQRPHRHIAIMVGIRARWLL